jgi:hypothetical protein
MCRRTIDRGRGSGRRKGSNSRRKKRANTRLERTAESRGRSTAGRWVATVVGSNLEKNTVRSKGTVSLLLTVFLMGIQSACIPFGDAWVSFSGHVKDIEGNPIKGAQLKILFNGDLKGEQSEAQSNDQGEFRFHENSCPCDFEFIVIAAKDGYRIFTKKIGGKEANNLKDLEIVLEPLSAASPSPNKRLQPTPR